jgi:hypothetical protein
MNLGRFKEKVQLKRIKKKLQNNVENRNISKETIHSIGVLANNSSPYLEEFIKKVQEELNCKQIRLFLFKPFSKDDAANENQFTNKDLNWSGNFINANTLEFLNTPFSLLIGYFTEDNLYLKNAVLQSKANFKVGFSNKQEYLFELVINTDLENTTEFIDELKKYLIALQKIKI